jgi:hypothetical protein
LRKISNLKMKINKNVSFSLKKFVFFNSRNFLFFLVSLESLHRWGEITQNLNFKCI